MEAIEQIKEINQHISDALEQWANVMLTSDANEWAYFLNYSDRDALNALFIVNHVLQNKAIKSGHIKSKEEALVKALLFKNAVKEYSGIDTIKLTKECLDIKEKENGNKG